MEVLPGEGAEGKDCFAGKIEVTFESLLFYIYSKVFNSFIA